MKRRQFLTLLTVAAPALLAPGLSSAFDFDIAIPGVGTVNTDKMKKAFEGGKKVVAGFEDITPEQEYYVGLSVAATILTKYKPLEHKRSKQYVNVMGKVLAQASDTPETFGGYHFMVLDTDEINALSAPGGFIFVTKGLLKCCKTEDAMASVLAHEIAHVQRKHGLQAIQSSRITEGVTTLVLAGTSTFSSSALADLTNTFDGTISDITTTMIESGYSREAEDEADHDAVIIMQRIGYDPNAFVDVLKIMKERIKPDSKGFAKTHPSPEDRIEIVEGVIGGYSKPKPSIPRKFRFMSMTGGL